jgi:hypothetical protein
VLSKTAKPLITPRGRSFVVAKDKVSGDLTNSNEPKKEITINKLSKPSNTRRRRSTKDFDDVNKRLSAKGDVSWKEAFAEFSVVSAGGSELNVIGSKIQSSPYGIG